MRSFAFGSAVWPGLSKLCEEAGEVVQVCGKLVMTGGNRNHWDGSELDRRLEDEIGDLVAASLFVVGHCNLDVNRICRRVVDKLVLFEKWHAESR